MESEIEKREREGEIHVVDRGSMIATLSRPARDY